MDDPVTRRLLLRVAGGFVLAFGAVGALFVLAGPGATLSSLRTVDPGTYLLGFGSVVLAVALWSEALGRLLGAAEPGTPAVDYRLAYLSGDFARQVLPMGHASGPVLLAYAVARVLGRDYPGTLAVVTVSELLGLAASLVVAALGLCALALGGTSPHLAVLGVVVAGGLLTVAVAFVLVRYGRGPVERVGVRVGLFARRVGGRVVGAAGRPLTPASIRARFADYYGALGSVTTDRATIAGAGVLALVGWCAYVAPLYTSAAALGVALPLGVVFLAVPVAGLATWLPLPGGLGGVEAALAGLLVALAGLDVHVAAAVALLYRICVYWFVVLLDGAAAFVLVSGTAVAEH